MEYFVNKHSVVREIWGKADTVLFIFAGASAEFALNKAVDWLYFTGKLPSDPLGRLFSTVSYARTIVFSEKDKALESIDKITAIHASVETKRGKNIPYWAYRDVLFMLIDYSLRSFELLERKLSPEEKQEVFDVFFRMGNRMGVNGLPNTFDTWQTMREQHLSSNLVNSHFTSDLYQQYRKHLGPVRYSLLLEAQRLVLPKNVFNLMGLKRTSLLKPFLGIYKKSRKIKIVEFLKFSILPSKYQDDFKELDHIPVK